MPMLDDAALWLEVNGIGIRKETIFRSRLPASPDDVCGVYEYSGSPPTYVHSTEGISTEMPRLQVVYRSKSYATAKAKITAAFIAIGRLENMTLNGCRYISARPLQSPFEQGRDENDRITLAFNSQIEKEVS